MDRTESIRLISIEQGQDEYGQPTEEENSNEVFCDVASATSNEFFSAGKHGMRATYKFTVNRYDYNGEPYAEYAEDGEHLNRYSIYRTYLVHDNDDIELHCGVKGGVFIDGNG